MDFSNLPEEIQRIKRANLDLSTSNRLLNMDFSKNTIPVISSSPDALLARLNRSGALSLKAGASRLREAITGTDGTLAALMEQGELDQTAGYFKEILDSGKRGRLYFALGMLRWREEMDGVPRYSPICLAEISVSRVGAGSVEGAESAVGSGSTEGLEMAPGSDGTGVSDDATDVDGTGSLRLTAGAGEGGGSGIPDEAERPGDAESSDGAESPGSVESPGGAESSGGAGSLGTRSSDGADGTGRAESSDGAKGDGGSGWRIQKKKRGRFMNPALLEMLKSRFPQEDLSLLESFDRDPHMRISDAANLIAGLVSAEENWGVLHSVYAGIFETEPFMAWRDLENHMDIAADNQLLRCMFNSEEYEWNQGEERTGRVMPFRVEEEGVMALSAAATDNSFYLLDYDYAKRLNIDATVAVNELYWGKTVLFICPDDKSAETFYEKMNEAGAGGFCLRLYRNNTKGELLGEGEQDGQAVGKWDERDYAFRFSQYTSLAREFKEYIDQIYGAQSCGFSLSELAGIYQANYEAPDISMDEMPEPSLLNRNLIIEHKNLVKRLINSGRSIGHPHLHPLRDIRLNEYSHKRRVSLVSAIDEYERAIESLRGADGEFSTLTGLDRAATYGELKNHSRIARCLEKLMPYPREWVRGIDINSYLDEIVKLCGYKRESIILRSRLMEGWKEELLSLSAAELLNEYGDIRDGNFLKRASAYRGFMNRISRMWKKEIPFEDLGEQFTLFFKYQYNSTKAALYEEKYGGELGSFFKGSATDWDQVAQEAENVRHYAGQLRELCGSDGIRMAYAADDTITPYIENLKVAEADFSVSMEEAEEEACLKERGDDLSLEAELENLRAIKANQAQLREWVTYCSVRTEAVANGLSGLVRSYEDGMRHEEVMSAYDKAVSAYLGKYVISSREILSGFDSEEFNGKLRQYQEMSGIMRDMTREEISRKLVRNVGRGVYSKFPCVIARVEDIPGFLYGIDLQFDELVAENAQNIGELEAMAALARSRNVMISGEKVESENNPADNLFTFSGNVGLVGVECPGEEEERPGLGNEAVSSCISEFFAAWGYDCSVNVPFEGFTANVAVKNPDLPDSYVMAVTIDYIDNGDKPGMGKVYVENIWLIDWIRDRYAQIDRLLLRVEELLKFVRGD